MTAAAPTHDRDPMDLRDWHAAEADLRARIRRAGSRCRRDIDGSPSEHGAVIQRARQTGRSSSVGLRRRIRTGRAVSAASAAATDGRERGDRHCDPTHDGAEPEAPGSDCGAPGAPPRDWPHSSPPRGGRDGRATRAGPPFPISGYPTRRGSTHGPAAGSGPIGRYRRGSGASRWRARIPAATGVGPAARPMRGDRRVTDLVRRASFESIGGATTCAVAPAGRREPAALR